MLNQPTNVYPSMLTGVGDGVIDATQGLTVSWSVSGDTPMLAYQIVIYQNDTASTQVYSTGKVTLAEPFYGTDSKGVLQTFYANTISASELSSGGVVNGYANGYKLVITQWWSADDSITQTSPSAFITRTTPTLSIDTIPSPVGTKSYTFTATYSQAEGDAISHVRWIFATANNTSAPLYDSGEIYTSLLQFSYDGLFSGETYAVRLIVSTSNGITVDTGFVTFDVSYHMNEDAGAVSVCKVAGENFIELSWEDRSQLEAETTGEVSVQSGTAVLGESASVTYSGVPGTAPWSIAWCGKVPDPSTATNVLELVGGTDTFVLTVSNTGISFGVSGGATIFTQNTTVHGSDTLSVIVTPTKYCIRQDTFTGGVLPSETLLPSDTLYPSDVTFVTLIHTGEISYTQQSVSEITLNGQQTCEYVWLTAGELSDSAINNITTSTQGYEPPFDPYTIFLVDFSAGNLTANISGSSGTSQLGVSIYRRDGASSVLKHIIDLPGGITVARDYGIKSRTTYRYFVFSDGDTTYTNSFQSEEITPVFGGYALLECQEDENGVFHVVNEYPFACNIEHGPISNNNSPDISQNFTRYPNRQPVSSLYKSGTLSALVGKFDHASISYSDSWTLVDEICALSTNTNPKFLRDMKGALWRIETSAAIQSQITSNGYYLPIKITIPWVEVDDSSDAAIVAIPGDNVFAVDQVVQTRLYVDTETGQLTWAYTGTQLSVNESSGNMLGRTPVDVSPATFGMQNGYLFATTSTATRR